MQLQNAAEGHEHKTSSNVSDSRSPVDAYGRIKHWWPSQAYHCTFCTRVFRTAQALGGHMNIHRRERACANDAATHTHIRSEPGHSMAEPACRPLFHMPPHTPPNPLRHMENCYASRRLPHVSSQLQNYAPVPADTTSNAAPRPGLPEPLHHHPGSISDPLAWLFSQLPPPGTALAAFPQPQSILMHRNLTKPYHRALTVSKSLPGMRRHVCRMSAQNVHYTGMMPSRNRGAPEQSRGESSAAELAGAASGGLKESLDLELRL